MIRKSLFFIAITPPEEIKSEIQCITEEISRKYNTRKALNSEPHITLIPPFWYPDPKVDVLKNIVSQLRKNISDFSIELHGYDTFPRRVLFIHVVPTEQLTACYHHALGYLPTDLRTTIKTYREYHPHITVAFKDISQENFTAAKEEYVDQSYHRIFQNITFTLNRHNGKRWTTVKI